MGKRKSKKNKRICQLSPLLIIELSCYVKPTLILIAVYAAVLLFAVLSLLYIEAMATVAYVLLYAFIASAIITFSVIPIRRVVLDIKVSPLYADSESIPKSPRPYAADLAAAKMIPIFIFSLLTAVFHLISDATVTYIGGYDYDGYGATLTSVSVLMFSFLFYMTSVALAAASDYTETAKKPRRRVVYSGVLLYTLGLSLLVAVVLCLSTVPLGSDAIADMSESGFNPTTSLWLSLIYFIVSLLRTVYLYFIIKRRLRRALKLL